MPIKSKQIYTLELGKQLRNWRYQITLKGEMYSMDTKDIAFILCNQMTTAA